MSNTVDTNQGLREGSPGPQSKSLTEFAKPIPYSLNRVDQTRSIAVRPKALMHWRMYPQLYKTLSKLGFEYILSEEEKGMSRLIASAHTRTSTVCQVIRRIHKGKEYLIYWTKEEGIDANGNACSGSGQYISHGIDKTVDVKNVKNNEGEVVKLELGQEHIIYTEEFTKDKFQEILNNNELDENIQFTFDTNGKSFGRFTAQEMLELSSKELECRGSIGHAGDDLSIIYSDLSAKDRLHLESQASKK
jgi:hypothetical protein